MSYYNFNPFSKKIKEINSEDLVVLKEVAEGWYIDYKEDIIDIKKIAKHISAFANQFGGWLFFGIKESKTRTADSFLGIDKNKINQLSISIREAVTAHSSPEIYYEEKIIDGPSDPIGLPEDKAIIIIYIPEGKTPPYVHSSGRIYRRVADHSDPKFETDRHILDKLWEKSKRSKGKLKEFIENRPDYKNNNPTAYIYLFTNPYFNKRFTFLKFNDFKESLSGKLMKKFSMPMNTFYSSRGGFIARQTKYNDPLSQVASFRWWHSGNALLTIPFNTFDKFGFLDAKKFNNSSHFFDEIENQNFDNVKICDLNYFLLALATLYNQFSQLKKKINNNEITYSAIIIENTFHISPFIDDQVYIQQIKENGIPLMEDNQIGIPELMDIDYLINVSSYNKKEIFGQPNPIEVQRIIDVLPLVVAVFLAFGIMNEPEDIVKFQSIYYSKN